MKIKTDIEEKRVSLNKAEEQKIADALRVLSADAVQKAGSGHPGMPLGMADIAYVLWKYFLKHNPNNPKWLNRDRFIVSNGHGSMLLYSLLHLTGYDLTIEELKKFRQLGSATPGHPEIDITPGVETTTGPLGQGLANAVGMALAEKLIGSEFNKPGFPIVDHKTFVFLGDGCLMEGISHEACALAGVWELGKLVCFYDDNNISIDGIVDPWFDEDVKGRFLAYGWRVVGPIDGHNFDEIYEAIESTVANNESCKPTLIICKTIIGKGALGREGTSKAHGEPLGLDSIAKMRESIDWPHPPFIIPSEIKNLWDCKEIGDSHEKGWSNLFSNYKKSFQADAESFLRRFSEPINQQLLDDRIESACEVFNKELPEIATRKASQNLLDFIGPSFDALLGGSADLTGSNLTQWTGAEPMRLSKTNSVLSGRHINFGVREFGMSAICSGIALHGGFVPYCGTFLVFSDYSRNAVRMAALMKKKVVFVFTHDSIGLGEDGPTHQPVEHAASLRLIPFLHVWRPADSVEVAIAWKKALTYEGPTALLLSRQKLPSFSKAKKTQKNIEKGGYILFDKKKPDIILIATGSEIKLAVEARNILAKENHIAARVVSIPSTTVFDQQTESYKKSVLPNTIPKMVIEAGVTDYWWKYQPDVVLGIDRFGESAPAKDLFDSLNISVETIVESVLVLLENNN